ncbi:10823_t:CDS:2, partial [Acaulospora morrowiae]
NSASTTSDQSRRSNQLHYQNNTSNYYSQQVNGQPHQSFPTYPMNCLRRSPGICLKFLPSWSNVSKSGLNPSNGLLVPNLYARKQAKRRSSPINGEGTNSTGSSNSGMNSRRRNRSWSQNSISGVNNSSRTDCLDVEQDFKQDDIGWQDMWSFHPSGILTLHRIWMECVVVGEQASRQGKEDSSNKNLITVAGTPLSGSAAAVANVGRVLVGGAAGVVGGITGAVRKEAGSLDMMTTCEDIAEWQVMRGASWDEVKNVIELHKSSDGETSVNRDGSNRWLANAEIATHTNSKTSLPPPLWATPQFTFQTFLPGYKDSLIKGETPRSKKIEVRRDVVERVELVDEGQEIDGWINNKENINGYGKTSKAILVPAGKAIGKGMGDISANLSTAMRTSLDFVPSSPTLSAISTKSRDRTSNGFTNGYSQQITGEMTMTPLSFEDAYHIHIANNIPNTSTSTFDDIDFNKEIDPEKDDASEGGNFFFSPDGDNEMETPSDSMIESHGGKHTN